MENNITSVANPPEEKKEAPATTAPQEKTLPEPTIEDFAKLDIRVGKITECWKVAFNFNIGLIFL